MEMFVMIVLMSCSGIRLGITLITILENFGIINHNSPETIDDLPQHLDD